MRDLPLVGDDFAGYRLFAVIGRGGMSTVYRAENPRLGNVIALKVMAPELAGDDVFRARFLEESRIAAGLNHPNVVPIHDSGSSNGLLYIAMRYVTGTDLRQMLKKRGRLPPGTAVFLLGQAARALDTAHRRGLVHRDVKPGNLLVEQASDDADPDHVYLTDFGITKHAAEHTGLTATGQFIGTVDYIAPEQIRGLPVLGLADQYSLGCVLYECLTGQLPFERDMNAAIIWAHVEEQPTQPTVLRPDLPRAVDEVFARVLAKQPGDRYGSCREFTAAAREALGSLAEPPGPGGRPPGGPPGAGAVPFPAEQYPAGLPVGVGEHPSYPAGPQPQRGNPEEIAHEPAGVPGDAAEGIPGLSGRAGNDQGSWLRDGAPAPGAGTALGGAGSTPPSWPPPGAGRGRASRRGPGRTARWLVPSVSVIVLALVAGVLVGLKVAGGGTARLAFSGNGTSASASTSPPVSASPSASPGMNMGVQAGTGESGPDTLAGVLGAANNSVEGNGLLPPAKCGQYKQNADGAIVCTSPVPGVSEVYYQNYSSLTALYDAYTSLVSGLDGGTFRQNTGTCGNSAVSYAEFGWNQEEGHPHNFTIAQMASGKVPQVFASGRMACFETRTKTGVSQDIVWTIDGGPAMGVAIGNGPARAVYQLWASLHHAVLFRGTEMCGTAERMNFRDIPTGNLAVLPVCPPGVEAVPASPSG
jgi:serine/threonine-protein kinase